MWRWSIPVALGVVVSGAALGAHHAINAVYDRSRQVTVEGTVAEFHFVNPHPFVTVDVTDGSGRTLPWRLEMDNRFELIGVGMTADTLRAGDRLVVTGSLARGRAHSLYVMRLDRPADGFRYEQVGSSPRVRRGAQ